MNLPGTTYRREIIRGKNQSIKMTEFENLPEHLIHYIMNFLPYKDATKCSVLSKAFKSLWLSYPLLEFDSRFFKQHEDPEHILFSHILKTLQLRSPHTINSMQKVRLSRVRDSPEAPFSYQPTFDMLVNFAIENTSKEIVFEIISVVFINVRYEPLVHLFSSEFLTVLNLTGLRIPIADPIIHCLKLKALKISRCEGLRTITVSSLCVEEVNIDYCCRLDGVHVPKAKNLKNLSRLERGPGFHPCEFDLPACESILFMCLYRVKVAKNNLTIPVTDTLHINYCPFPKNFRIQNPKLKELKIWDACNLDNLFLFTPNLERLCFVLDTCKINPSYNRRLTMNISACVALTVLEFKGIAITDEWVKSVVSNLEGLKELIISECTSFRNMVLKNDKLEILSLKRCYGLNEVIVDSPNLLKFDYHGSIPVYPMTILSTKCSLKIRLPPHDLDPILQFDEINQFLSCFNHIQDITITSATAKDLIFPIDRMSETNPFPLRDLKHMKVEISLRMPDNEDVMKIIEGLLWLVPKPLKLTLSVRDKIIVGTLKFEYGKEVKRQKVEEGFVFGVRTRCWRDYEIKVDIQGFNESVTRDLNKFFAPYMH